jgi:hypothetical protein
LVVYLENNLQSVVGHRQDIHRGIVALDGFRPTSLNPDPPDHLHYGVPRIKGARFESFEFR